jgi:hypothetical protein
MNQPNLFESIVLKDACYNALSFSCSTMKGLQGVDFENFFLDIVCDVD